MTAEQQLERSVLEGKERDELSAIAQAMSLKTTTRTKKADIIDRILDATGVTADGDCRTTRRQRRRRTAGRTAGARQRGRRHRCQAHRAVPVRLHPAPSRGDVAADGSHAAAEPPGPTPRWSARRATRHRPCSLSRPSWRTAPTTAPPAAERSRASPPPAAEPEPPATRAAEPEQPQQPEHNQNNTRVTVATSATGAAAAAVAASGASGGELQGGGGQEQPYSGEMVEVKGMLDLRDEGYGFLRCERLPAVAQGRLRLHQPGPAVRPAQGRLRRRAPAARRRTTRSTRRCCASTRSPGSIPKWRATAPVSRT